jgi:hypothetical protein
MYQRISDIVHFKIVCYLQVLHISSCMLLFLPFFIWLLVAPSMYSYVSLTGGLSAAVTSFLSDLVSKDKLTLTIIPKILIR